MSDVAEPRTIDRDHAPARAAKARIEAQNANRVRHVFRNIARLARFEKLLLWLTGDYREHDR